MDHTITAVVLLGQPRGAAVHMLQVADAEQYLENVDPRRMVPYRVPVSLVLGLGGFALVM